MLHRVRYISGENVVGTLRFANSREFAREATTVDKRSRIQGTNTADRRSFLRTTIARRGTDVKGETRAGPLERGGAGGDGKGWLRHPGGQVKERRSVRFANTGSDR